MREIYAQNVTSLYRCEVPKVPTLVHMLRFGADFAHFAFFTSGAQQTDGVEEAAYLARPLTRTHTQHRSAHANIQAHKHTSTHTRPMLRGHVQTSVSLIPSHIHVKPVLNAPFHDVQPIVHGCVVARRVAAAIPAH